MAESTPHTCYEPKLPDDFHFSETTEISFRDESSDAEPSYLCDAELDDETVGKAPSSPLFIQEREENQRTEDKLITLMKKVCETPAPGADTRAQLQKGSNDL